jgi:protein-S-isoprenylcysteine O-methyltransferase Ste14
MNGTGAAAPLTAANIIQGLFATLFSIAISCACLFLSAGTFDYPAAWMYEICLVPFLLIVFVWMIKCHPKIFLRRLEAGPSSEQSRVQKAVMTLLFTLSALFFIVPGLDHRYGWSHMSQRATLIGLIGSFASLWLTARVTVFNQYMNANIAVEATQTVVQTGPYAVVRHPLYSCTSIWFGFTAVALGSWWCLLLTIPIVLAFTVRLLDEERQLKVQLAGYTEYSAKVRWRLVPCVF